jgi:hypothetical protein
MHDSPLGQLSSQLRKKWVSPLFVSIFSARL